MKYTQFVNNFGLKPIPLEDYLTPSNQKLIQNYNLFYILKPLMETDVFKIGISSGTARLTSYLNTYGQKKRTNPCSGVLIYYLIGTKKQDRLGINDSFARFKEKQLMKDLERYNVRGNERFKITEQKLFSILNEAQTRHFRTKKEQMKLDNLELKTTDRVLKVLNHTTFKNGKVKQLLLYWNRPSLDDKTFTTYESITKIKNFPQSTNAFVKARSYITKNNLRLY